VLKAWVDGHGRRPCTNFQGWAPSSHFLGQCIHCGQFILMKISKTGATRCQILRLKCTKFDFRSAPDPAGGAYSATSDPIAVFKGPTFKGRERRGKRREGEERGAGRRRGGLPEIEEYRYGSGGGEEGEGQGGELGLGRPGTSFFPL